MYKAYSKFSKLVQIEQTLFGLPLALVGALFPFANQNFKLNHPWTLWVWIILAFSAARSAGMSFNRLIDYEIDLKNPRTNKRPLQAGEITFRDVKTIALLSLTLFVFACSQINLECLLLSPIIAFLLWSYSYTKRFTFLCHFYLGIIEFFAPLMGWLAVGGGFNEAPLYLGLGMCLWIAGMDIFYATQDIEFDRAMRLHSLPALVGAKKSFLIGKIMHGFALLSFVAAGIIANLSMLYFLGLFIVATLFLAQHKAVHKDVKKAFFTYNSLIAITLLLFTLGAVLWHV